MSVVPEIASVSQDYSLSEAPISVFGAIDAASGALADALNGGLGVQDIRTTEKDEEGRTKYVGSLWWEVWILFGQYVWVAGMGVMLLYSAVSYLKIRKKLLVVVPLRDNIFLADDIKSPFVVGLFRPKIYLPCNLEEKEQEYIILHEQYHIKRLDHIIKALAFLALAIHWFNPLVWVAFILASKDMEMSCDEAVIGKIGDDVRADYSASLLTLATGRRIIAGTPLAFGEGDTKSRIRNLANWRKPAFWVVLISVVACIALAVCLLIDPAIDREFPMNGSNISELDTEQLIDRIAKAEKLNGNSQLFVSHSEDVLFATDFTWLTDDVIRYYYFKDQKTYSGKLDMSRDENKYYIAKAEEWINTYNDFYKMPDYLEALKYIPQEEIRQMYPDADCYLVHGKTEGIPSDYQRVITYTQNGIEDIDEWDIHLFVSPTYEAEHGGYYGSGEELLHLFYDAKANQTDTSGTIKAPSIPVAWTCSPMMSATWHAAFYFEFAFDYTHIKANCDQGELWNLHGEEQSRDTHMQFESTNPICWTPATGDSLAEKANVDFTVYDDETQLYTGRIEITKLGEDGGRTSYAARLINAPTLYMLPTDSGTGAKIITVQAYEAMTSPDTVIWNNADLDHDGRNETIHVREMYDGTVYELSVVKQDGTILWSTEAAQAHAGWNSILLYEEGGKDYLLRYTPVMYQGVGNYTWTQFFFEGGYPKEAASMNVDFELPTEINNEMRAFAEKTNSMLKDSTVLLTTEQGMAVVGPKPTIGAPQIYAVYFDPNDIAWDITSNTPEVLDVPSNNTPVHNADASSTMLGPYLFDLPLYGRMDAEKGFSKHYAAGTDVRISGEWRGDYPLSFVFCGEHTDEDVIAVVYSGSSKTITLPTDDDWTCSVSSNGGRTDGNFWLYVSE